MINIIIILLFLLIWILVSVILIKIFYREKPLEKLKYFNYEDNFYEREEKQKKEKLNIFKILSNFVPKVNSKKNKYIEKELINADIPVTVEELFVIKITSSSFTAFLIFSISKDIFLSVIIFLITWNIPLILILRRKNKRIKQFDSQLSEGLMVISNSLKAGYSFLQAVAAVTEEMKDPFAKEFKKLLKEMSFGIPEEDALKNLSNRMESEDLKLIINAILIQKDTGGNLSEILENINETIRERQKLKNELKTLTAQGRLSGIIIALIPVFLGLVIYILNKDYIIVLFTRPIGIAMTAASVFNEILGLIIIRKIISIDM